MVFVRGSYSVTPEEEFQVHPDILRIRAYQRKIDELNAPPQPVAEVEAVPAVRPSTKTTLATAWLASVLKDGPLAQQDVEAMGREAGFNLKMLKRAKARLRVISVRKGANHAQHRNAYHTPGAAGVASY